MTDLQNIDHKVIVLALDRIFQAFRTVLWDYAKRVNLSPIQIQILVYLFNHKKKCSSVTELASEFNLTAATVSDACTTLQKKNLIEKKIDNLDKRISLLSLTKQGKTSTSELVNWQNKIIDQVKNFPIETKRVVLNFLVELIESLRNENMLGTVKTCLSCMYFSSSESASGSEKYCLMRHISLEKTGLKLDCPNYDQVKQVGVKGA